MMIAVMVKLSNKIFHFWETRCGFSRSFPFCPAGCWWGELGPNLIIWAKTGMSSDPNEIQTWLRQKAAEEEEEGEASVWYL